MHIREHLWFARVGLWTGAKVDLPTDLFNHLFTYLSMKCAGDELLAVGSECEAKDLGRVRKGFHALVPVNIPDFDGLVPAAAC